MWYWHQGHVPRSRGDPHPCSTLAGYSLAFSVWAWESRKSPSSPFPCSPEGQTQAKSKLQINRHFFFSGMDGLSVRRKMGKCQKSPETSKSLFSFWFPPLFPLCVMFLVFLYSSPDISTSLVPDITGRGSLIRQHNYIQAAPGQPPGSWKWVLTLPGPPGSGHCATVHRAMRGIWGPERQDELVIPDNSLYQPQDFKNATKIQIHRKVSEIILPRGGRKRAFQRNKGHTRHKINY